MRRYLQPSATIGPVPKPKLSAPSMAALTTSRPVFRPPSVCTPTLSRRSLARRAWWASARPSSHGEPAYLTEVERARAGAAVVAGDGDQVGVGLGHAGGDGADAGLGHQLDRDQRLRVDLLEVEDQLGQILDGIDVVVRRRRNQGDAGHGAAQAWRSVRDTLSPGSWPPSPGLAPWAILICSTSALTR